MTTCKHCSHTPLPYVMVIVISSVLAFVTWLTLDTTELSNETNIMVTSIIFVVSAAVVLAYVVDCMRRHCSHDHAHR